MNSQPGSIIAQIQKEQEEEEGQEKKDEGEGSKEKEEEEVQIAKIQENQPVEQQILSKQQDQNEQEGSQEQIDIFNAQNRKSLNAYRKSAFLESSAIERYFQSSKPKKRKTSEDLNNSRKEQQNTTTGRLRVFSDQAEQLQKLLNQEQQQQVLINGESENLLQEQKKIENQNEEKKQDPIKVQENLDSNWQIQDQFQQQNDKIIHRDSLKVVTPTKQRESQKMIVERLPSSKLQTYKVEQSVSRFSEENSEVPNIELKTIDIDIATQSQRYSQASHSKQKDSFLTEQNLLAFTIQNSETTHTTPNFKFGAENNNNNVINQEDLHRLVPSQTMQSELPIPIEQQQIRSNSLVRYQTEPIKLITQVSQQLMGITKASNAQQIEQQIKEGPIEDDQEQNQENYVELTQEQKIQQIVDLGLNWLIRLDVNLVFKSIVKVQKFWKKMRRVLRSYRRRKYIVNELCDTEQSYLKNLDYLIKSKDFLKQNSVMAENPIIQQSEVKVLFSNVQTLRDLHNKFYKDIQQRVLNWHQFQKVGDVFLQYAPFFRLYNEYCSNYQRAQKIYQSHTKRPLFQDYIQNLQKSQDSRFLTLNSFIIMPVQRPLKYPLLLKDLLKHTRTDHPDYKNIKKAHSLMDTINKAVNADLKKRVSEQKKIQLQNQYGDKVQIINPSRYFICDEVLTLIQAGWNKEVLIYFFSDLLLLVGKDNRQAYIGHLNLDTQSFIKNQNDFKYFQHIFTVTGGTRSYRFSAATLNKKIDVLQSLQDIVKNIKSTSKSRASALISSKMGGQSNSRKHTMRTGRKSEHKDDQEPAFEFNGESQNPFLEVPPLIVGIVGTQWRFTHTVYILVIERGKQKHRIFRRYSDFDKLHKSLSNKYQSLNLPKLPKKRWLTFKTKVIEERKLLLEKFLQELVLYKIFQNDLDLMNFLQITEWSLEEFEFQGESVKHQPTSISHTSGTYQTEEIKIFLCNNTIHKIPVRLDEKALELQRRIAYSYGIQNYKHWGLFVIEPYQDEKLIDEYDKPLENMKRRKGLIETAISKFSQKNSFYCTFQDSMGFYLKIENQSFVFKKVFYPERQFTNQYDLSKVDYRELDLLYHQLLAMIATSKITLQTSDLIEASAQYLYITFGEKPKGRRMKKDEILRLVSKTHKKSKVQGFWQDRILEKWQEVSKLHAIKPSRNQQPSLDLSIKELKITMIKMIRRKNFYGSQFYWVNPHNLSGDDAKQLCPFFWLIINYKSIFFLSANTNKIQKQFSVQNVQLQIYPTALIFNAYKTPIALAGRNSKRQQLTEPMYSIRLNTPRGYEISNLVQLYQTQIRQKKSKERLIGSQDEDIYNRHTIL